jgi:putative solute:sodium symporter small subunit
LKPEPTNIESGMPILKTPYWRRTRQLTAFLLAVWFLVTLLTIFFARELSAIALFGWPLSFYMAAQGATIMYLAIVGLYAWRMKKFEKIYNSEHADVRK